MRRFTKRSQPKEYKITRNDDGSYEINSSKVTIDGKMKAILEKLEGLSTAPDSSEEIGFGFEKSKELFDPEYKALGDVVSRLGGDSSSSIDGPGFTQVEEGDVNMYGNASVAMLAGTGSGDQRSGVESGSARRGSVPVPIRPETIQLGVRSTSQDRNF